MEIYKINDDLNCIEAKPQYFIVILSNKDNLDKCIKCKVAGFPETKSGMWAYLDINKGDYVSFYYNGKIINLYKVIDKFIPKAYAIGASEERKSPKEESRKEVIDKNSQHDYDPVPLEDCAEKWNAIKIKKNGRNPLTIRFPYRFNLELVASGEKVIFDKTVQMFGLNLIPRGGLQKSHVQLPLSVASKIFDCKISPYITEKRCLSFDDFEALSKRWNVFYKKSINIIKDEFFLQVLIKRILIFFPGLCFTFNNKQEFEILSEQAVEGGEVDLVIRYSEEDKVFIEVKNYCLLKDFNSGNLNSLGRKACKQLSQYKSLNKNSVTKCIAGKTNNLENNSIFLRVRKLNQKDCDWVIEVNEDCDIKSVSNKKLIVNRSVVKGNSTVKYLLCK